MLLKQAFQKLQFGLFAFLVEYKDEANDVPVTLLVIIGLSELQNLFLLLIDILSLQPLDNCLGRSLSVVSDRFVFVFSVKQQHCGETFYLIFSHKLLVLASINTRDMHSFAYKFGEFAVFRFKVATVSTLD